MDPLKELEGFDAGRQLALMKKLGGRDVVNAILRGEVTMEVRKAIRMLFDKHGRRIPKDLQANVCDANRNFRLDQPTLLQEADYANRIMRLGCLGIDTRITGKQLMLEDQGLRRMIADMPQVANILNGICLPTILVKRHSDDLGTEVELHLEAVGKSYIETFDNRNFHNHRKGTLTGNVEIVEESRYEPLWERKKKEHIIVLFFPNPLQGFSIYAQREQMATLPEGFILSGAIEPMIMFSDILARDYNTPDLDLAAFSWRSADYSRGFRARGGSLAFDCTGNLSVAHGRCSGGLLFLG